jgi:voltage-gated sodium channel
MQQTEGATWRRRLGEWIESPRVQNFIIGVILLNAVTLGMETSSYLMSTIGGVLMALEYTALTIFVLEILIKLVAFRHRFFRSSWNVFDFIIVGISVVPAAVPLTVLRTLRVLRALRLLRTLPRLRLIVEGVLRVLPDMGWVFLLLVLVFYVFSVIGTKLFAASFPAEFGNIGDTMFTLFQVMTLESWASLVARPVMAKYPFAWIYFVAFVLTASFIVLNMVIGVVVTAFQGVMQGVDAPPGVPPTPDHRPTMNIERELEMLHIKIDRLLEERGLDNRSAGAGDSGGGGGGDR